MVRFKTAKGFAEYYNLTNSIDLFSSVNSHRDGLISDTIKLREVKEIFGPANTNLWISAWLVSITHGFMGFEISPEQAKITSALLYKELYMINVAEFTLFFNRLISGYYGQFYGKFNGQIILSAARKFRQSRGNELIKLDTKTQKRLS